MELNIGLQAITSYRRLAYSPWHALAEFVDNATQSFFDNREILETSDTESPPLTVEINYSREDDVLIISDNAMGMSEQELAYAMTVANRPNNTSGRSKYGMGLKTAASWIGNKWTIRTKKYGETVEITASVDVEMVARGDNELEVTYITDCDPEEHYTVITITDHNRIFYSRTLGKIGIYLSSMYRQDFRNNILRLIWQESILDWDEIDELILRARDGSIYKRDFSFTINPSSDDENDETSKTVRGWVAILEAGSRSKAGFSILHANRVIKGYPDAWRPSSLFGQIQGSNDLVNQRLIGEIHLDEFDVSHTKDDILWMGDEEYLVEEKLKEHCWEYREVARTYRKGSPDQRKPGEGAIRLAVSALKKELGAPEIRAILSTDPMLPSELVTNIVDAVRLSVSTLPETFVATIGLLTVKGYIDDMSINDPYLTIASPNDDEVLIIVNSAHPHWNQIRGSDGVRNFLRHCIYDGIAEYWAKKYQGQGSTIMPETLKLHKDKLLRIPFEIEQREGIDEDEELDED